MQKTARFDLPALALALTVAMLLAVPAGAQPARPQTAPDISGEWRLENHDRVQDLIKQGKTLEQVRAARPTMDSDGRFGATTGPWTTDMFVEAVYKSLKEKK